jgi:molecular chaperone GrpE (heat shock protein)
MLFGRKNDSEKISQMKAAVEESVAEAFRQQAQEQSRQQEKQQAHLDEILEKNHKAVRNLADTVEDFLDSMEEEDRQQRQSRQEREQGLLELVGLYQQQMELVEQWMAGQENSKAAQTAWEQQYAMLRGKIMTESRLCAIENTGASGEPVDYRLHEVLQAVEPETAGQEGTIAEVYSQGMLYQGTVIRKARVSAYRRKEN